MRWSLPCFAFAAVVIAACWAWLGAPVTMPQAPLAKGEKLWCVSYAPFRGSQTPLDPTTRISAAQIDDDLARLARITNCVRVYSTDYGIDQVAGIAAKHGLKVLQGLWLSSDPVKNRSEIDAAVALANRYPDTVRAVIVGNEVLLRGEMSPGDLGAAIREVKAQVKVPVTYADVWEYWLRNASLAGAVDFVTVHILPYWEDLPVPAAQAARHVEAILQRVRHAFPGKRIVIGEVGWPSAGRMREGALPSQANQARVIQDVLALAKREHVDVNVIESFDAPWKRAFEGTVGGHWGLFDDASRTLKFGWGEAVSNHPAWPWQAGGGIAFAALVFATALFAGRGKRVGWPTWLAVTANALAGGILLGWAVENVPLESLGAGLWLRSLALVGVAFASAPVVTAAIVRQTPMPRISAVLNGGWRNTDPVACAAALILIATLILAIQVALGLVFDPRYKDFPFAPFTAAIVPLLTHSIAVKRFAGARGVAEIAGATLLGLAIVYILPDETLANWQSLWLCAAFAGLAVTLLRVRAAPS
jgi:exo-beta-1,3-glucanase (GH17 family)